MGYRYPERESAGGWILHLDSARTREGERVRRSPKPPSRLLPWWPPVSYRHNIASVSRLSLKQINMPGIYGIRSCGSRFVM